MDMLPLLRRQQLTERLEGIKEGRKMTWEQVAKGLYQILDDISTVSDWCKGNSKAFMENVLRINARRNQFLTSTDGNTLKRVNESTEPPKEIPLTNSDRKALVDAEDYDRVAKLTWYLKKDRRTNVHYVAHGERSGDTVKTIRLHRFVMNAGPEYDVHHKDTNPLNCQKDNLEVVPKDIHRGYHTRHNYSRVERPDSILALAAESKVNELKKTSVEPGWYVVDVIQPEELLDGPYGDKEAARTAAQQMKKEFPDEDIRWGMMKVSEEDVNDFTPPDWRKFKIWMNKVDAAMLRISGRDHRQIYDWHYRDDFEDGVTPQQAARNALEYYKGQRGASESVKGKKQTWTGFVTWDPNWKEGMPADEEVDVEAENEVDARRKIEQRLKTDYVPGGRIIHVSDHPGGWTISVSSVKESKMTDWAKNELQLAGLFDKDSDYDGMLGEAVMELVDKFSEQGHSGFSAELTASIFDRLVHWKPLSELTNDPNEWNLIDEEQEARTPGKSGKVKCYQSRRSPDCFSEDGGMTYYSVDDSCFEHTEDGVTCMRYCPETWAKVTIHTAKKKE